MDTAEFKPIIKVKSHLKDFKLKYQTSGSSGFDIPSLAELMIMPGSFELVPTGLSFEIPEGYEVQIRPRSGLAARHGITVLNAPGTIDSDYRGPIGVILVNHSPEPFKVTAGMRIAQGVVQKVQQVDFEYVDEISQDTKRGSGGYGSTGL